MLYFITDWKCCIVLKQAMARADVKFNANELLKNGFSFEYFILLIHFLYESKNHGLGMNKTSCKMLT